MESVCLLVKKMDLLMSTGTEPMLLSVFQSILEEDWDGIK